MKVTRNVNLVPCPRERRATGSDNADLMNNVLLARKLIRIANHFFCLRPGAIYSGYIDEKEKNFFTLKLWEGDRLVRLFIVSNLGYGGMLHVDIPDLSTITFDLLIDAATDKCLRPSVIGA